MNRDNSKSFTLPGEYRKIAEKLFPKACFTGPEGFFHGEKLDIKAVSEFAKVLGIFADYQRVLMLDKNSNDLLVFLGHFQNNLDLLISKTWVEKSDETRKNKLQDEVPIFMEKIKNGEYSKAIEMFSAILVELSYLFFGSQSEKEDFTEYTFRIDAQMGLFWWYGSKLTLINESGCSDIEENVLWAILLLGICYLTNF